MSGEQHPIDPQAGPSDAQVGAWLIDDGYPWDPSEQAVITITTNRLKNVARQAFRAGVNQELEACCAQISQCHLLTPEQRAAVPEYMLACRRRSSPTTPESQVIHDPASTTSFHPAPFQDFSIELRDPWPVVERLRLALREAERYCAGAENITGHCIADLLERLPAGDD